MPTRDTQTIPDPVASSHRAPGFAAQALILAAWILFWAVLQWILTVNAEEHARIPAALAILAALFGAAFLVVRKPLVELLSSLPFASLQLALLALSIPLGLMARRMGGTWSRRFLAGPFAEDAKDGIWFFVLLALAALSMALVAWRRRSNRPSRWGFLMVHASMILLFLGGVWNATGSIKAMADLRPGKTIDEFEVYRNNIPVKRFRPGFMVRLESFRSEWPQPEYRVDAYAQPDGKGGFETRPKSYTVQEGFSTRFPATQVKLDLERFIPNAVEGGSWVEAPEHSEPNPALRVLLGLGTAEQPTAVLLARGGEDRVDEPMGRFAVVFREAWDAALADQLRPRPRIREKLILEVEGRVHETELWRKTPWDVCRMRFTFKAMFPHFATRTKPDGKVEAFSASDKPVDPWVQLEQDRGDGVPRKVFLSARQPVVSDHLNQPNLPEGARLRYVREGEEPQWRFAVFTKSDKRVRLLEDGRVKREEPFDVNRVFVVEKGLSITPLALWEHAEYQADFRPHPDPALASRYLHPALKLRLTDLATGECESRWLDIADPRRIDTGTRMLGGRVGLVLRQRRMEPKAMFSDLNILDTQGNTLARKVVGLGDPLLHAGFKLYQIGSGMEGGESSTILIMREPGRPLIITGLLLLLAGACWMFHLKPWFKERESASMKVAP